MTDNIVTTDLVESKPAKKTGPAKGTAKPKKEKQEQTDTSIDGSKYIYFSCGAAYVTSNGFVFTRENPIYLVANEEADSLLRLDNFRLPDQIELEEYLNKA